MRRLSFLLLSNKFTSTISRQLHSDVVVAISPPYPAVDQTMDIRFHNLPALTTVRLETRLAIPQRKTDFISQCHFKVDSHGTLDLSTTSCDGPSYEGVDPMGILWSMDPQPGSLTRLYTTGPLQYALNVFNTTNQKLFSTSFIRNTHGPDVSSHEVRQDGLVGRLFVPSGAGPFPAVIKIAGSPGIKDDLAGALASKGFIVLALAYYKQEGLPEDYSSVRIEYFEKAVDFLQTKFRTKGVGVLGCSKGCDLALSMAAFLPREKVTAVATVNGGITSLGGSTSFRDITIKPHMFRKDFTPKPGPIKGVLNMLGAMIPLAELPNDYRIPIESSEADILMVAGEDDHQFESLLWAEAARQNCEKFGKNNFTLLTLPGMGHALDAPFSPVALHVPNPFIPRGATMYMGGLDKKMANRAQLKAFKTIVEFFNKKLAPYLDVWTTSRPLARSMKASQPAMRGPLGGPQLVV